MARKMTISIRGDIKDRMDAAPKSENWSRIACDAFEARLASIAAEDKELDQDPEYWAFRDCAINSGQVY